MAPCDEPLEEWTTLNDWQAAACDKNKLAAVEQMLQAWCKRIELVSLAFDFCAYLELSWKQISENSEFFNFCYTVI